METDLENLLQIDSPKSKSGLQSLSDKYHFLNTLDISEVFVKRNWNLVTCNEARVTKRKYLQGYQKHILIFENEEYKTSEGNIQLVIRNSHDGFSALEIFYGFMRICCSNQLFIKDLGEGRSIKLYHKGTKDTMRSKLDSTISSVLSGLDLLKENFEMMSNRKLDNHEKISFAKSVLSIRYGVDKAEAYIKSDSNLISNILSPLRSEDNRSDAWTIYNIVQEKFTKNEKLVSFVQPNGRMNVIRGINSIYTAPDFNQKIWEKMIEIVKNDN